MSIPTSATTPPRPISSPTSRRPDTRSEASKRSASTATISGAAAMMIAATDESTCCSPNAMNGNGTAISKTANASSQRPRPRSDGSVPARHASASSTTAASTTRHHARKAGGTPSSTAILMNRYGTPQIVDIAKKPAHARALMGAEDISGRHAGRRGRGPGRHHRAGVAVELQLLAPAEQREADSHERVADLRPVRHRGDPELDLARVEPLPDLVAHLPALEVAAQRPVVPAPDAHGPSVLAPLLVDHAADADAEPEVEPDEACDEQHVAALEGRVLLEDRVDGRAVGERVVAHERLRALEAPAWERGTRRLGRQRLAAVVVVPALLGDELPQAAGVEVVAATVQVVDGARLAGKAEQALELHSTRRVWMSRPPVRRPPDAFATRSRNEVHMCSWISFAMRRWL